MSCPRYLWYNVIYQDDQNKVLVLDVRDPTFYMMKRLQAGMYVIASFSQTLHDPVSMIHEILKAIPEDYDVKQYLYFLVNSPDEYNALVDYHDLLNIRSWSNACRTHFDDQETFQKAIESSRDLPKYTGLMISKNTKFKRHFLTWDLPHILYIVGQDGFPFTSNCKCGENNVCSKCMWDTISINSMHKLKHSQSEIRVHLTATEVRQCMYEAGYGMILSASEGSCYASLECLLHGLPVISTISTGGRSNYYNSENSIICEPTKEGVTDAIQEVLSGWKNGRFDSNKIRTKAIEQHTLYRGMFRDIVATIFKEENITLDATQYFDQHIACGNNKFLPVAKPFEQQQPLFQQLVELYTPRHATNHVIAAPRLKNKKRIVWTCIAIRWDDLTMTWIHDKKAKERYLYEGGSLQMIDRRATSTTVSGSEIIPIWFDGHTYPTASTHMPWKCFAVIGLFAVEETDKDGYVKLSKRSLQGDMMTLDSIFEIHSL